MLKSKKLFLFKNGKAFCFFYIPSFFFSKKMLYIPAQIDLLSENALY
ncbi:hypothetical protein FORC60_5530 [Bacillus cereus]|nr:hypothetical protein FORC60_5530 [Bacillus cereus]